MGIISSLYVKKFVCRYDKQPGVPYYSYTDFEGLHRDESGFTNSKGIELKYFYFYYDNYKKDKIVLFLHGLDCGHAAYMAEINELAKRGYKVLAVDYTGCGESKGKYLRSLNAPTSDVLELLDYLNIKEEIVPVGHSMGGFTTLNLMNLKPNLTKGVVLAGFLSIKKEIEAFIKSPMFVKGICKYERKQYPKLYDLDNVKYLRNTKDKIFFIQSEDDQMVPYETSLKVVEEINNPNIKTLRMKGRKHNPTYLDSSVKYMNDVFSKFNTLLKEKKIKTKEDRINYFKDVSLEKLVEQDAKIFDEIAKYINK